ncbi:MAG: acyltransferase family protein [Rubripirellula sp.]
MRSDLSVEAKQTFQVVALLATILVVGIHYKSDVPDFADPANATWNELIQEFLFGGIGRVAVPLFAFAAGLFYFRSDDGTFATYRKKLSHRTRSVFLPYFIIGSIAFTSWLMVRRFEGNPVQMTPGSFLATWLLRPPAEQLWFLRDLLVLVLFAPLIRRVTSNRWTQMISVGIITCLWAANWQVFPMVAGWHLVHMETLLFFMLGCIAVSKIHWIEVVGRAPRAMFLGLCLIWIDLVVLRICRRADFDIWYATDYGWNDLLLHQFSVIVGCFALFMLAWRIRCGFLIRLSGASFFVYLIHEFPLRAVVERVSDRVLNQSIACWVETPLVLLGCFGIALVLNKACPSLIAVLTGGRTPKSAAQITNKEPHIPNHSGNEAANTAAAS